MRRRVNLCAAGVINALRLSESEKENQLAIAFLCW